MFASLPRWPGPVGSDKMKLMTHVDRRMALRQLPAIGTLLALPEAAEAVRRHSHDRVVGALQEAIAQAREALLAGEDPEIQPETLLSEALSRLDARSRMRLRRVVNATGVVLNTNLGRAPLAPEALEALLPVAGGYSNLEYDLEAGKRGSRYAHLESLLCELSGAEAALVVNNNAAAVLLVVDTLAKGREVVVSRGQLVEIGGSFRLPDVIASSGARLVEVGTTNKTHRHDYARAIGPETAMLLRSHTSNFKLIGFTSEVEPRELAALGREHGVPTVEDLGSGVFLDLMEFGLPHEPTVQASVRAGIDLVTFSGDKLLGGPQAGLIVGRRALVDQLKQNPLLRALRQDKLTLAALEATLRLYLNPDRAKASVPTLRMLAASPRDLEAAATRLCDRLVSCFGPRLGAEVAPCRSQVGGGALPGAELDSFAVTLAPWDTTPHALAARLRAGHPAVVGRLEGDRLWLDVRTLLDGDDEAIVEALDGVLA